MIAVALEPGFEAREVESFAAEDDQAQGETEEGEAAWSAWMSWRKAEGV